MRLRRETGDFQIVVNTSAGTVNTIRTGLSAEDLAGELIKVGGVYEPVLSAGDSEGTTVFETKSYTLTYTKATGAITAEANSDDGGSGGGSTPLVIECVYDLPSHEYEEAHMCFGETQPFDLATIIQAGLTKEQLFNAVFLVNYAGNEYDQSESQWVSSYVPSVYRVGVVRENWCCAQAYGYTSGSTEEEILRSYNIRLADVSNTGTYARDKGFNGLSDFDAYYDPVTGRLAADPTLLIITS